MGNYIGQALRLRFKADTPEWFLHALRDIASLDQYDYGDFHPATISAFSQLWGMPDKAVALVLGHIASTVGGDSAYFETWNVRRLTQEANGEWLFYTKGSASEVYHQTLKFFLLGIRQFLVMAEGDVLYRCVFEEGSKESVFYVKDNDFVYGSGEGFHYHYDGYDVRDGRHPTSSHCDVDWDPPMTMAELAVVNLETKTEDDANYSGYGF